MLGDKCWQLNILSSICICKFTVSSEYKVSAGKSQTRHVWEYCMLLSLRQVQLHFALNIHLQENYVVSHWNMTCSFLWRLLFTDRFILHVCSKACSLVSTGMYSLGTDVKGKTVQEPDPVRIKFESSLDPHQPWYSLVIVQGMSTAGQSLLSSGTG